MKPTALPPWGKSLLLLAGVALLAAGLRLLSAHNLALLHPAHTVAGIGLFTLIAAAGCAVGLPRQLTASAAALAFGLPLGLPIAMAAQMLGCAADFYWARFIGRAWTQAHLKGRLARADQFLAANPASATLMLRLLPVGNNLALNLLAGVSSIRALPFLAGTLLGYLPQTLVFALAGTGRVHALWLAIALFAASTALGLYLAHHHRARRA